MFIDAGEGILAVHNRIDQTGPRVALVLAVYIEHE